MTARSCLTLALVAALAPGSSAGIPLDERPFPMTVAADRGVAGLALVAVPDALDALESLQAVRLVGVPLPGGGALDVDLERLPSVAGDGVLALSDGPGAGPLDAGLTLWTGHVAGDAASEVFLAFSRWGSRGWVRSGGHLLHLLAVPGTGGAWSAADAILIDERGLTALGVTHPEACLTTAALGPPRPPGAGPPPAATTTLLDCPLAIETDVQYFQLFGDVDAARTYVVTLVAAVSARYREQIGVVLTLAYLGLHENGVDPWSTQETPGGGSIDLLFEFQSAWDAGAAPAQAGLYHFLSGAAIGGGVAFLPGLCDPDYAFGVSGSITGMTPFPIVVGPLNWDFTTLAHEVGHGFNARHTHDYCPPIDECAPANAFGQCQTQQSCTTLGTLMSYCHLCDGGQLNETTYFHPQSVADMRAWAEASCLQPFKGVLTTDLGFGKPGNGPAPGLAVTFSAAPDTVHVDVANAFPLAPGSMFLSAVAAMMPFKGAVLVPGPQFPIAIVADAFGDVRLPLPATTSLPRGLQIYAQAWFKDAPGVFAATNAVAFELVTP